MPFCIYRDGLMEYSMTNAKMQLSHFVTYVIWKSCVKMQLAAVFDSSCHWEKTIWPKYMYVL